MSDSPILKTIDRRSVPANYESAFEGGIRRAIGCGHWFAWAEATPEMAEQLNPSTPREWEGPHRDTEEEAIADCMEFANLLQKATSDCGYDAKVVRAYEVN